MRNREEIHSRMDEAFDQAAMGFGLGLATPDFSDSINAVTFGTALYWALGLPEDDLLEYISGRAAYVHRENPKQFAAFKQGVEDASQP